MSRESAVFDLIERIYAATEAGGLGSGLWICGFGMG